MRGVTIEYFSSLDTFIKSKASKIEFITEEWIEKEIGIEALEDKLIKILETYKIDKLSELAEDKDDNFEAISSIIQCTNTWISDFYVYDMADGSIRVEVTLESELEVEYATREVREDSWESEYVFSPWKGDFDFEQVHSKRVVKEAV